MSYSEFISELNLSGRVVAVMRVPEAPETAEKLSPHCFFQALGRVLDGETLILTQESCGCRGFGPNSGFTDGKPPIPGGYELFLSTGAGEGYRPGERIKCSPEVALAHFNGLAKNVMEGFSSIRMEPYREGMESDIVTVFATVDQLAGLMFLHDFRRGGHDNAIVATTSACNSLFRTAFGELDHAEPKAVIGCLDMAARPYIDPGLLSFTVPARVFDTMLEDTERCFFHAPFWGRLKKRL